MVSSRVASLTNHNTLMGNFNRVQQDLATLQRQISSGRKAQAFNELEGKVERTTSLENKLKNITQYESSNALALARVNTMITAADSIQNIANEMQEVIVLSRSATEAQYPLFRQQMDNLVEQVASLLNTNISGRYLFAGGKTEQPPVEIPVPNTGIIGTPDAGYYQGDSHVHTVRSSENLVVEYGVKADHIAFQTLFAAAKQAIDGFNKGDPNILGDALDLMNTANEEVNAVRASINNNIILLNDTNDLHRITGAFVNGAYGEEISTDVVAASTEVALNESVLQASFSAFARISSLSLTDFLR